MLAYQTYSLAVNDQKPEWLFTVNTSRQDSHSRAMQR